MARIFSRRYQAMQAGRRLLPRAGTGPRWFTRALIRPYSHSLSDDERLYKTAAERAEEAERDPLATFPELLIDEGIARPPGAGAIIARDRSRGAEIRADAFCAKPPPASTLGVSLPLFG